MEPPCNKHDKTQDKNAIKDERIVLAGTGQ